MNAHPAYPRHQQGVALAVVLILLLVMTLLGLAAMRGTLLQERMSGNAYDRSLAFQAAEAALREAESLAKTKPSVPSAGCNAKGVCATPLPTATPRWDDSVWNGVSVQTSEFDPGASKAIKPRYLIEWLGKFPSPFCTTSGDVSSSVCTEMEDRYRITARSTGANRADVTLQTTFAVP